MICAALTRPAGSVALTAAVSWTLNTHVSDAQSVLIETKQYWLKSTAQPTDTPPSHSHTHWPAALRLFNATPSHCPRVITHHMPLSRLVPLHLCVGRGGQGWGWRGGRLARRQRQCSVAVSKQLAWTDLALAGACNAMRYQCNISRIECKTNENENEHLIR